MTHGMIADRVTAPDQLANQIWTARGVDTGHEESGFRVVTVQQGKNLFRCGFERAVIKSEGDNIFSRSSPVDDRPQKIGLREKAGCHAHTHIQRQHRGRKQWMNKKNRSRGDQNRSPCNQDGA